MRRTENKPLHTPDPRDPFPPRPPLFPPPLPPNTPPHTRRYYGGHSDVLCGLVVSHPTSPLGVSYGAQVRAVQASIGAVPSPFDCFLVLRGLRTMGVRVERACESAMELAAFLDAHPKVARCHYPGLASHPGHAAARAQMGGEHFGGMLSFEVAGGEAAAVAVAASCELITRATSLGGTETLIEHRASIEPEGRVTSPPGLLRVSVGLEDVGDLRADLERALEGV